MEFLVVYKVRTGGWAGCVSWMVGMDVGQGGVVMGTLCGETTGEGVCGAGGSRTSERQRTRGLRTGAYIEELHNTGISDVSWLTCNGVRHGLICHRRRCHWSIT